MKKIDHFKRTKTYSQEEHKQIASTIRSQIHMWDLAACGASEFICGELDHHPYLRFKVNRPLGKRGLFKMYVFLMPSDTYTVQLIKCNTKPKSQDDLFKIIDQKDDIYCEELSQTIYSMCNK